MKSVIREYITSDLHFYHSNIIKYADRTNYDFTNVNDVMKMNYDIVEYINREIPDENNVVLWNLGDVFYGKLFSESSLMDLQKLVATMKGNHRTLKLVLGNHDRQFKRFAKWNLLYPLNANYSFKGIFELIGFDYVYEYPVILEDKFILSHEPIYLEKNSHFTNIHGHTHQKFVGSDYFTWRIENRDMVLKAYCDSHRVCPKPDAKKDNWEELEVNADKYINVCWDSALPRVFDLNCILKI